jgi:hypothetical protein
MRAIFLLLIARMSKNDNYCNYFPRSHSTLRRGQRNNCKNINYSVGSSVIGGLRR